MKIRVGQIGWGEVDRPAHSLEDTHSGVDVLWVEIDGHRFEDVVRVDLPLEHGITIPAVHFVAAVEIVYTDTDGEPLP